MSIVVASANRGKLAEVRAMLADLPIEVLCMAEALGKTPLIAEDGDTFEENARHKAEVIASATGMITLADDSGLEVDALGGRPGVHSARFAGEGATDAENNAELLKRLLDIDDEQRSARFRCAIALVDPWSQEEPRVVVGRCEGHIAHKPSGTGGFGYDPLFVVTDGGASARGRTLAELDEGEKNRISHRGRALAALRPHLEEVLRRRLSEARAIVETSGARAPSA